MYDMKINLKKMIIRKEGIYNKIAMTLLIPWFPLNLCIIVSCLQLKMSPAGLIAHKIYTCLRCAVRNNET